MPTCSARPPPDLRYSGSSRTETVRARIDVTIDVTTDTTAGTTGEATMTTGATDTSRDEQETAVLAAIDAIRPALQADGGDIVFKRISDDGIVYVQLVGACSDCAVSTMTLKAGVERIIKDRVPGIVSVEEEV